MQSSWPHIIRTPRGDYHRCRGLYLSHAPVPPGDISLPPGTVLLHDTAALLAAAGVPNPTAPRCHACACCSCSSSAQARASRRARPVPVPPPYSPPGAALNRPPGTTWVYIDADSRELPEGFLPVYRGSDGVFAVDPRVLHIREPTAKDPYRSRQHRFPKSNPILDISSRGIGQLRVEKMSSTRPDLHWIPAISPAAAASLPRNWHHTRICIPDARAPVRTAYEAAWWGLDPVVAVIDAGIDPNHPDLRPGNITYWTTAPGEPASTSSEVERDHGTSVVGIIVANGQPDQANDSIGIAPACAIVAYDVRDWSFQGLCDSVEHAAATATVKVLSLSFAYYTDAGPTIPNNEGVLAQALQMAQAAGKLVCAAAGNAYADGLTIGFPACHPGVMAVAAIDEYDDTDHIPGVQSWSSRHEPTDYEGIRSRISVAAPGYEVLTTRIAWNDYLAANFAGTSAATPQVAALAALLFSKFGLPADAVRKIIEATAEKPDRYSFLWERPGDPSTRHPQIGYGCIDVAAALTFADVDLDTPPTLIASEDTLEVTVKNQGPTMATEVTLTVWVVHVGDRWSLQIDPSTGTIDLHGPEDTRFKRAESFMCEGGALEGDEWIQRVSAPSATSATSAKARLVLMADAANDHAFHRALATQPATPSNYGYYNNLRVFDV